MTNYSNQTMPYANNARIITGLSRCDQSVNITETIKDLYSLYVNNTLNSVSSIFSNVSIINYNCNLSPNKYFEQIITFTKSVSIRIQIAFASIYYDYINANQYSINGFYIEPEQRFNLSSITLDNQTESDACSSAEIAHDPLCPSNGPTPICINMFSNPWIFNCSENTTTSTIASSWITNNNNQLLSTTTSSSSSILSPWQIGLVCGLSVLFLLIFLVLIGYFFRRHLRSKRITFSSENLFTDMKSMSNSGIPQVQAFQRVSTIIQPKPKTHNTTLTPIHYLNGTTINKKLPGPNNNRTTLIDHAKIHDRSFISTNPQKLTKSPIYIPNNNNINTIIPKVYQTTIISRPISGTPKTRLKSITDGLEEDTLDEWDNISLDRSNSPNSKKPSTPNSRQFISSIDESLHDEDAWMSILAVANAELDVLNQLENEQKSIINN